MLPVKYIHDVILACASVCIVDKELASLAKVLQSLPARIKSYIHTVYTYIHVRISYIGLKCIKKANHHTESAAHATYMVECKGAVHLQQTCTYTSTCN